MGTLKGATGGAAHVRRNKNTRRQPGANTSNHSANDTPPAGLTQRAKRLIFVAAVWGVLSHAITSWLLRRLGLVSE